MIRVTITITMLLLLFRSVTMQLDPNVMDSHRILLYHPVRLLFLFNKRFLLSYYFIVKLYQKMMKEVRVNQFAISRDVIRSLDNLVKAPPGIVYLYR